MISHNKIHTITLYCFKHCAKGPQRILYQNKSTFSILLVLKHLELFPCRLQHVVKVGTGLSSFLKMQVAKLISIYHYDHFFKVLRGLQSCHLGPQGQQSPSTSMTVTPATFVGKQGKQTKKDLCSCSISRPAIEYTQQLEILSELPAPNLKCQL